MTRPTWDELFMNVALTLASRSTCDRAHVGAVLVRDNRIIATGYNGSLAGTAHCDDVGHLMADGSCHRTVHAEANAVVHAALHGVSTRGATAYVTHQPCINCLKLLLNAGVARIVYNASYRHSSHELESARTELQFSSNAQLERTEHARR